MTRLYRRQLPVRQIARISGLPLTSGNEKRRLPLRITSGHNRMIVKLFKLPLWGIVFFPEMYKIEHNSEFELSLQFILPPLGSCRCLKRNGVLSHPPRGLHNFFTVSRLL